MGRGPNAAPPRSEQARDSLSHYVQDMRKRAGFNIADHIQLSLYTSEDLASVLRRHKKTLQSETLADTLSIVVDQPAPSLPDEVYHEKISPRELKKLENYTLEVILGRL